VVVCLRTSDHGDLAKSVQIYYEMEHIAAEDTLNLVLDDLTTCKIHVFGKF
jgi:hypothetical protein